MTDATVTVIETGRVSFYANTNDALDMATTIRDATYIKVVSPLLVEIYSSAETMRNRDQSGLVAIVEKLSK